MDRLSQLELFVKVVELSSLSQAAQTLGMSNAAASRHLAALEDRLGARLLERNTRRLWLTEAGTEFHQRCVQILGDVLEAEDAMLARVSAPVGLLRVASSLSFATLCIAPLLPEFRALYPGLNVQITAANRYLDFIEAGIDVAIRTREHEPDSGIIVRKLGSTPRLLAAAPDYFARRGIPKTPADLSTHDMLIYNLANEPTTLNLRQNEKRESVRITSVLDSNDGQIIRQAALNGLGILIQPLYIIIDDIKNGRLVPVLQDWDLPILNINIAYQNRARLPAKIRVFSDFLTSRIRIDEGNGIS
jgi:DNA-binding transcriptional LysR family regulator